MKNHKQLLLLLFVTLLAISMLGSGCAVVVTDTKIKTFPMVYEENPLNILVLPPMNESTSPDAKEYFMSTLVPPLTEMGYYILPTEIVNEVLKNEGVYDSEVINSDAIGKFADYFGADAVLWTTIKQWDKSYMLLGGNVEVEVEYSLQSTKTQETLWSYMGKLKVDTGGDSSGGLFAMLVETAIKTATTDYVPIARKVNVKVMNTMPAGNYHPRHGIDQEDEVLIK